MLRMNQQQLAVAAPWVGHLPSELPLCCYRHKQVGTRHHGDRCAACHHDGELINRSLLNISLCEDCRRVSAARVRFTVTSFVLHAHAHTAIC